MKSGTLLFILTGILFISFFSGNLVEICNAENGYSLSIVDKTYEYVKTREIGGQTWVYFNINITLYNSGNIESDDITVEIEDEDGVSLRRNGTIMPEESETFKFEEHPLMGLGEHIINISYFPTDQGIAVTDYNSGSATLVIKYGDVEDSTPGFELIFLLSAAVFVFLIRKKFR